MQNVIRIQKSPLVVIVKCNFCTENVFSTKTKVLYLSRNYIVDVVYMDYRKYEFINCTFYTITNYLFVYKTCIKMAFNVQNAINKTSLPPFVRSNSILYAYLCQENVLRSAFFVVYYRIF